MTKYELLGLTIGWILTIFIGLLALMIVLKVWKGDIDLNYLISDELGYASLSRFQFLVFTFVVAMSLFYLIVVKSPPEYPTVPNEILALLGISGGSYVLSKGIQTSRDVGITEVTKKEPQAAPEKPTNTPVTGDDDEEEEVTKVTKESKVAPNKPKKKTVTKVEEKEEEEEEEKEGENT